MKKEYIRSFLWGGAVGAIVLLIVIFSAGWVVTSGSAEIKAKQMVASAVMNRLALISVAQFMQDPNKEERLTDLKKLDYWKRGEIKFIKSYQFSFLKLLQEKAMGVSLKTENEE